MPGTLFPGRGSAVVEDIAGLRNPSRQLQVEKVPSIHKFSNDFGNGFQFPSFILRLGMESQVAREQSGDADYYRFCATEMMAKAQAAPSKAVRRAYLNLALNWVREAVSLQKSENGESAPSDRSPTVTP